MVWLLPDGVKYFAILINVKQPRSLGAAWRKTVLEEYGHLASPGKEATHSQTSLNKVKFVQVTVLFSGNSLFVIIGSWTLRLRRYFQGRVLLPSLELPPHCPLYCFIIRNHSVFLIRLTSYFVSTVFILLELFYGSHFSANVVYN